ncbi:MAG: hypothetical protein HPY53_05825 [Brevinematales bacterium]|nr:hypothetical protein [Brevinematales bacterium]
MPDSKAKRAKLRAEFHILREFLLREYSAGYGHLMIWKNGCFPGDPVPPPFDSLNTRAQFDAAMLSLIRLTDPHKDAVSFDKLLKFAENHPHLFADAGIGEIIASDRARFEAYAPLRENLQAIRDRHYAHPDRKYIAGPARVFTDYPVSPDAMEELYRFIGDALQKYRIEGDK